MKLDKSAFTLIEIVIALLVLAIGLMGILALFPVGIDAVGRANNTTMATFLAQGKLEEAKVEGYATLESMETAGKTAFPAPYSNFEYTLSVTAGIDDRELKQVDVTVYWPASGSSQRNIKLSTYIAKYEP